MNYKKDFNTTSHTLFMDSLDNNNNRTSSLECVGETFMFPFSNDQPSQLNDSLDNQPSSSVFNFRDLAFNEVVPL
jgi:hypothetical protein